jgi:hypothetical protein
LRENPGLEKELSSYPYYKDSLLNIRDALHGGRTQATKTYYRVKQGERINSVDVISLYPYICKYGKIPVGHPKAYVGADCPPDCLDREGIMKYKVLSPRKLYHTVLPYKSNSKLMFPLCSACANTMNKGSCTHSDEERRIVGTSIAYELRKAVDMGYGLVEVFEFWEYSVKCFDKDINSVGVL